MTVFYNPEVITIQQAGWRGPFGADPSIPSPPVTSTGTFPSLGPDGIPWLLQSPNAKLNEAGVFIDPTLGRLVVTFDWGTAGYHPITTDPFYFFGIYFTAPANTIGFRFVPRGTGDLGLVGSETDVVLNGNAAATYLQCSGGYCGEAPKGDLQIIVSPEPSTILLLGSGLGGLILWRKWGVASIGRGRQTLRTVRQTLKTRHP